MNTQEQRATTPKQTPTSVAAATLGVSESTLGVIRRNLSLPELRSLGVLLAPADVIRRATPTSPFV